MGEASVLATFNSSRTLVGDRMYPATEQLIKKIKTHLQSHPAEDEFNDLALQVAAYQVEYNPVMRRFYRQQGVTLRSLRNWSAIPAMPIVGFKELTLSCEPIEHAPRST